MDTDLQTFETLPLKKLPLHNLHEKAQAKFGAFAGWMMPLVYPLGVLKEHLHTRAQAGLFDISHMKLIAIEGQEAAEFLSYALPIDAFLLKKGQSRYNYLLNEQAGILDDLVLTRLDEYRFMLVVNAGNAQADFAELQKRAVGFDCKIVALERVLLALQGPQAASVLADAGLLGNELLFMQGFEPYQDWFVTRSGYTGEDGFEIALSESQARSLVEKLLDDYRVEWIGLAARDSLRLEAGLCLHGNDITPDTTPIEAALTWAVSKSVREKAKFYGAEAFLRAYQKGPSRCRVGLKPQGRQPVRAGAVLLDDKGKQIGIVTSGGFGPSFNGPVAMGYVPIDWKIEGTEVFTEVRGKKIMLSVHSLPFVEQRYFKG
ncbi:aminomethyltransferase [Bartonella sp. CDC_skunk]|uniref:glycine cleavage system aminomethyltransferase GcvT n=1 Tax=unclassified Bartonella TaxID=2645622 RepID=UPI000999088E|nr:MULTISPECIES: glycine cleavage system aminomethyltransferase GcvT [unclassified Bartonella]AQX21585.1 aminomethyltransferase [Bartonella sp. CDC_skunk]AQX26848.1 aminomethyltransferase [Bartonella sp. Raccoon60]